MKPRVPLLTAATIIGALALAGCGDGARDEAPVATTSTRPVPESVWNSPQGRGLQALFPPRNGSQPCVLRGGGPSPGITVPATCATVIEELDQGRYQVMLVEQWKARDFSGNDSDRPDRTYAWTFTISGSDQVVKATTQGDFPPHLVK